MNLLDLNASRAIDGTFGGTYNPSGPININGTLNVTNFTFEGGTVVNTMDTNIINCNVINIAANLDCNGVAEFDGDVYLRADIRFVEGGTFYLDAGTFLVRGTCLAKFDSDVEYTVDCTVDVKTGCSWTFNNSPTFQGGFNAYSTTYFHSTPSFNEGISITSGKLISYAGSQSWVVRFPFLLGCQAEVLNNPDFAVDSGYGFCKQIANPTTTSIIWTFPQGLWGETPVNITGVEVHVRANGLSGTPGGLTQFQLHTFDEDFIPTDSWIALNDTTPNNSTNHAASWSGIRAYNPLTDMFGINFQGYNGGDTLAAGTKWYEIKSVRMTLQTNARGIY
jgi:hypothetical protein